MVDSKSFKENLSEWERMHIKYDGKQIFHATFFGNILLVRELEQVH